MPRFEVTKNMGSSLKAVRTKKNIKAMDVAKSIDKTGAFISKLEKGDLKTIEVRDLYDIVLYLTGDEEEIDDTLATILKTASINYSSFEKEKEEWFLNFDYFYRTISVPNKYVEYVNHQLSDNKITQKELVNYINSNKDLYNDENLTAEQIHNSEKNTWYFNEGHSYVVMETSLEEVASLLSLKNNESNYGLLFCIVLSIFRLTGTEKDAAYFKTDELLKSFNIYTLMEKQEIIDSFETNDKMNSLLDQKDNTNLSEEDRHFYSLLYQFTEECDIFAELHKEYMNKKLETFIDNFKNDPVLVVGLMGVDLSKMHDTDIKIKKELVNSINKLIDEYSKKEPDEVDVLI